MDQYPQNSKQGSQQGRIQSQIPVISNRDQLNQAKDNPYSFGNNNQQNNNIQQPLRQQMIQNNAQNQQQNNNNMGQQNVNNNHNPYSLVNNNFGIQPQQQQFFQQQNNVQQPGSNGPPNRIENTIGSNIPNQNNQQVNMQLNAIAEEMYIKSSEVVVAYQIPDPIQNNVHNSNGQNNKPQQQQQNQPMQQQSQQPPVQQMVYQNNKPIQSNIPLINTNLSIESEIQNQQFQQNLQNKYNFQLQQGQQQQQQPYQQLQYPQQSGNSNMSIPSELDLNARNNNNQIIQNVQCQPQLQNNQINQQEQWLLNYQQQQQQQQMRQMPPQQPYQQQQQQQYQQQEQQQQQNIQRQQDNNQVYPPQNPKNDNQIQQQYQMNNYYQNQPIIGNNPNQLQQQQQLQYQQMQYQQQPNNIYQQQDPNFNQNYQQEKQIPGYPLQPQVPQNYIRGNQFVNQQYQTGNPINTYNNYYQYNTNDPSQITNQYINLNNNLQGQRDQFQQQFQQIPNPQQPYSSNRPSKDIIKQKAQNFPFIQQEENEEVLLNLQEKSKAYREVISNETNKAEQNRMLTQSFYNIDKQYQQQLTLSQQKRQQQMHQQQQQEYQNQQWQQQQLQQQEQQYLQQKQQETLRENKTNQAASDIPDVFDIIGDSNDIQFIDEVFQQTQIQLSAHKTQKKFQDIVRIMNVLFQKRVQSQRKIDTLLDNIIHSGVISDILLYINNKQERYTEQSYQAIFIFSDILMTIMQAQTKLFEKEIQTIIDTLKYISHTNPIAELNDLFQKINDVYVIVQVSIVSQDPLSNSQREQLEREKSEREKLEREKLEREKKQDEEMSKQKSDFMKFQSGRGNNNKQQQNNNNNPSSNQIQKNGQNNNLLPIQMILGNKNNNSQNNSQSNSNKAQQQEQQQQQWRAQQERKTVYKSQIETKKCPCLNEFIFNEQDFKEYLEPMPTKGCFQNIKHYLSVQYYLLREDTLNAPKRQLSNILQKEKLDPKDLNQDFRNEWYVYCNVRIVNMKFELDCYNLELKVSPAFLDKGGQFGSSKRLMNGSLIFICDEQLKQLFIGTVHYVDPQNDQTYQAQSTVKFSMQIVKTDKNQTDSEYFDGIVKFMQKSQKQQFYAFEMRNYWQSVSHCLKQIRKISKLKQPSLPFSEIIVNDSTDLGRATFIKDDTIYKIKVGGQDHFFNVNLEWPKECKGSLDQTQYQALKNMLTKKISIIQGPPGTGKSYVGLEGVKILLQNWEVWNKTQTPLLIICKTNQALDQFLLHILKFEQNIMRIGRRCIPELEDYLIAKEKVPHCKNDLKNIQKKMNKNIEQIVTPLDQVHKIYKFLDIYTEVLGLNLLDYVCNEFLNVIYLQDCVLSVSEKQLIFDRWWRNRFDESIISELAVTNNEFARLDKIQNGQQKILLKEFFEDRLEQERNYLEKRKKENNKKKIKINDLEKSLNFSAQTGSNISEDMNGLNEELLDNIEFKPIQESLEYQEYNLDENLFYGFINQVGDKKGLYMDYPVYMSIKIFGYKQQQEKSLQDLFKNITTYKEKSKEFKEFKKRYYLEIIKRKRVLGMTVTGAQMNIHTLSQLKYQIVILEEAAQILESHLIPILTPSLQQIIMIGDHQQLKPQNFNYSFEGIYNFNQSLMERLIFKGVEYVELRTQRRMNNLFSSVIRIFYPALQDHDSVKNRPAVKGMQSNFLFLEHDKRENEEEADYVVNLAKYILSQNQFKSNQITILTLYNGQCKLLKQKLSTKSIQKIEVSTVDNYQGEENEIIILSLVRSNESNDIGFLKSPNRINVAFSRAKVGFYVIGDIRMFQNQKNIQFWQQIVSHLFTNNFVQKKIESTCPKHNTKIIINSNEFSDKSPNGGCLQRCDRIRRSCGHKCDSFCHQGDCNEQICKMPCQKQLNCGHKCQKTCSEECGNECFEKVQKLQTCGHYCEQECQGKNSVVKCMQMVDKKFNCGHFSRRVPCYQKIFCTEMVQINVQLCEDPTHRTQLFMCGLKDKFITNRICTNNVKKYCNSCNKGSDVKCGKQNLFKCKSEVKKTLPCSHQVTLSCYEQKVASEIPCPEICNKVLKDCGHYCKNKCGEKCKCNMDTLIKTQCCGIEINLTCAQFQQMKRGQLEQFPCKCNTNICRKHIAKQGKIGEKCNEICEQVLPCFHTCKSKCKDCLYGLLHQPCQEKVEKILVCGHKQVVPCSQSVLYAKCDQAVKFMGCDKLKQKQKKDPRCWQKPEIDQNLKELESCNKCSKEKVLTLKCNHSISFPQVYFDYFFKRNPQLIPICKEPRCGQLLTHHAFSNQIKSAFKNIHWIQQKIQSDFTVILTHYQNEANKVTIDYPYPALDIEEKLSREIKPLKNQQEKEEVNKKNTDKKPKYVQILQMRISLLKQIIKDYEYYLPRIYEIWCIDNSPIISILCEVYKSIEPLYFQCLDNERFTFYKELHSKILFLYTVIKNNKQLRQNYEFSQYADFPFQADQNTINKIIQMFPLNNKTGIQINSFYEKILSLQELQMFKCPNSHIYIHDERDGYCMVDGCYEELSKYNMQLDI